jgi:hypothetical protein
MPFPHEYKQEKDYLGYIGPLGTKRSKGLKKQENLNVKCLYMNERYIHHSQRIIQEKSVCAFSYDSCAIVAIPKYIGGIAGARFDFTAKTSTVAAKF